ncbi:MAG: hypothetical protein FWF23_00920 [Alphaproteobacteria bacterium]|nr:hypothetical protein [Alphaproteobacteria bacterium]MCL2505038.1 hypothetical protein [Alphaproteobacteria bacterium]
MNIKRLIIIPLLSILFISCSSEQSIQAPRIPRVFSHDQVPDEVKNKPMIVNVDKNTDDSWPRLGDVPGKPKDFPTKAQYNQEMDDLMATRLEAEMLKEQFDFEQLESKEILE